MNNPFLIVIGTLLGLILAIVIIAGLSLLIGWAIAVVFGVSMAKATLGTFLAILVIQAISNSK